MQHIPDIIQIEDAEARPECGESRLYKAILRETIEEAKELCRKIRRNKYHGQSITLLEHDLWSLKLDIKSDWFSVVCAFANRSQAVIVKAIDALEFDAIQEIH